ncbi:MAG: hypothetical protein PHV06_06390 [bacterium]|nr:hypothetical protein [bacterium]
MKNNYYSSVIILILLFFKIFSFCEIFLPQYILENNSLLKSPVSSSFSQWIIENNENAEFYPGEFYYKFNLKELNIKSGIGFIKIKYFSKKEAEESILNYKKSSSVLIYPPVHGSFTGIKIGNKNYVQGFGIKKINENQGNIPSINYYKNNEYFIENCSTCSYHIGLYVIMEDGWVFEVYQTFINYKSYMGKLDPELLEYLADKCVEVYYAKKCEIKIEPHKWNLN